VPEQWRFRFRQRRSLLVGVNAAPTRLALAAIAGPGLLILAARVREPAALTQPLGRALPAHHIASAASGLPLVRAND